MLSDGNVGAAPISEGLGLGGLSYTGPRTLVLSLSPSTVRLQHGHHLGWDGMDCLEHLRIFPNHCVRKPSKMLWW